MNRSRVGWPVAVMCLLSCYGFLAVHGFLVKEHANSEPTMRAGLMFESPPDRLAALGGTLVQSAIDSLNDNSAPPESRLRAYSDQLWQSQNLLQRSLRVSPVQALTAARLAAVRWELEIQSSSGTPERFFAMVEWAARMAPTSTRTQVQLGEVLLRIGHPAEATEYLARAVELDPRVGRQAVSLLRSHLVPAEVILRRLPHAASVLDAVVPACFEDDNSESCIEALLESIRDGEALEPLILRAFGDTCVGVRDPALLLDVMGGIDYGSLNQLEAERLRQLSRGHAMVGEWDAAAAEARKAAELVPSASFLEHEGGILVQKGDYDGAASVFRDALGRLALQGAGPSTRARLYGKIGQAAESAGRTEQAYDAYRMGLSLNPNEPRSTQGWASIQQFTVIPPDKPTETD